MKFRDRGITVVALSLSLMFVSAAVFAEETKEQKKSRIREEKIRGCVHESLVKVRYYFKKSERPEFDDDYFSFSYGDDNVRQQVLLEKTVLGCGVIIGESGNVFVEEDDYSPDVIEKIVIETYDGKKLQAKKDILLTGCPGQLLKVTDELPASWTPVHFEDAPKKIDIKTKLFSVNLDISDGDHGYDCACGGDEGQEERVIVSGVSLIKLRQNTTDVPDYLQTGGRGAMILCDEESRPIGITCQSRIDLKDDAIIWRGKDILADNGVSIDGYSERIENLFSKYLYMVQISFRPPPQDEEYDMGSFGRFFGGYFYEDEDTKEIIVYGLAFGPDKILLPMMLDQSTMAGVDSIEVQIGSSYYLGNFCGTFKEIQATVIELDTEKVKENLPDYIALDTLAELPRCKPFWTIFVREMAGKDFWIQPCRWLNKTKGYKDQWYRIPSGSVRQGSWLLTTDGQFAGLYIGSRMDYDRYRTYLLGQEHYYYGNRLSRYGQMGSSYYGENENPMRFFDGAALAEILTDCSNKFDPHIKHLDKDQQKRRCWLGVEFAGVSKEMAKQMDLRKQTYDGHIGLIVNRVYPNSPAAAIGLQEGDVLIRLEVFSAPWPIDLKKSDRDDDMPDWEDIDVPEEFEAMGFSMPRKRPWPGRDNIMTRMLSDIGQGEKVTLTFLHEGSKVQKDFEIQMAPRDFFSAAKYKDEKLGLTVKNLTYEVINALRLESDQTGIIVAKVEEGTPAALGRVQSYELIRAVDSEPVDSVDAFEEKINSAKENGKESVRLTVEWMGKTRLTDLKFDAQQPNMKNMLKMLPGM